MKSVLAVAALLATASFLPETASAGGTINRCEARDGTLVFTDQQCHLLGTSYALGGDPHVLEGHGMPGPAWCLLARFRRGRACGQKRCEGQGREHSVHVAVL